MNTEFAKAVVDVDGSQAGKQLEQLSKRAKELRGEMVKLADANDLAGFQKAQKELKGIDAAMKNNRRTVFDLERVMSNLNGSTMKDLERATGRLTKEIKEATKNTKEEIQVYNQKVKQLQQVKEALNRSKTEAGLASKAYGGMGTAAQKVNGIFGSLKSLLPALGIGALVTQLFSMGKEFFNLSKEIEQFDRKARVVFGESLPSVTAAAVENANQIGLTRKEYIRAAANMADLLVPLGFTRERAAGLSVDMTNLSGALAEWSGGTLDAVQVNEILSKALLGETEQMKQLGVVIDQSSKAYNERVKHLHETQGLTMEQAKALDIMNQVQQKSIDAQTSFAAQGETMLRTQREIATWWRQMKENVVGYFTVPVSEKISRERDSLNLLVSSIMSVNDNQAVRNGLIEDLQKAYPNFLEGLSAEKLTNEELKKRLQEVNAEYEKKILYQVYEEDIEANMAASRLKMKEQKQIVKDVNAAYEQYVKNKQEGLTLEEKVQALQQAERSFDPGYLGIPAAFGSIAQSQLESYIELQQELNTLKLEYQDIMTAQKALGIDPVVPAAGGGGGGGGEDPEARKKRLESERNYRDDLIAGMMSLQEQENLSYNERLRQAGLFGKEKKNLTGAQLEAYLILEQKHQENVKKLHDQAFSEEISEQEKIFNQITQARQTAFNNSLAAMGEDEAAKAKATEYFQLQELERQKRHLEHLVELLKGALEGEDVFPSVDETLLSEEGKEALRARLAQVMLMLSELGLKVQDIQGGGGTEGTDTALGASPEKGKETQKDIFGMSQQDWDSAMENIQNAIGLVGALSDIYGAYSDFRKSKEQADLMDYETSINTRKELLERQLAKGIISQESYNSQIAALDADMDQKKRELTIKQAKREKALALMSAIVNTASAMVQALNTQPTWLGIVLSALVGVMGGLQIAAIASQPIPQYYRGKYDVMGQQDRKRYRASMIDSPGTGLIDSPAILVGEKPEIIIDPYTTRNLQLNYPYVIDAINAARVPQFSSGTLTGGPGGSITRETMKERELPREFYETISDLKTVLWKLQASGIPSRLVADGDYIETHNKVMGEFDAMKNSVTMK